MLKVPSCGITIKIRLNSQSHVLSTTLSHHRNTFSYFTITQKSALGKKIWPKKSQKRQITKVLSFIIIITIIIIILSSSKDIFFIAFGERRREGNRTQERSSHWSPPAHTQTRDPMPGRAGVPGTRTRTLARDPTFQLSDYILTESFRPGQHFLF